MLGWAAIVTGIAIGSPLLALLITPWRLPLPAALRVWAGGFLTILIPALVFGLAFRVGTSREDGLAGALAIVAIASSLPLLAGALPARLRAIRLSRALVRLSDPARRDRARARVLSLIPYPDREYGPQHIYPALIAAPALLGARLYRDVEAVLGPIPDAALTLKGRITRAVGVAYARVSRGDLPGARSAVAWIDRPAPAPWEDPFREVEAIIAALEARGRDALAIVGDGTNGLPGPSFSPANVLAIRAHAFVALGDEDRARSALHQLHRDHGDRALADVIDPPGPASSLATSLLNNRDAPYR